MRIEREAFCRELQGRDGFLGVQMGQFGRGWLAPRASDGEVGAESSWV